MEAAPSHSRTNLLFINIDPISWLISQYLFMSSLNYIAPHCCTKTLRPKWILFHCWKLYLGRGMAKICPPPTHLSYLFFFLAWPKSGRFLEAKGEKKRKKTVQQWLEIWQEAEKDLGQSWNCTDKSNQMTLMKCKLAFLNCSNFRILETSRTASKIRIKYYIKVVNLKKLNLKGLPFNYSVSKNKVCFYLVWLLATGLPVYQIYTQNRFYNIWKRNTYVLHFL